MPRKRKSKLQRIMVSEPGKPVSTAGYHFLREYDVPIGNGAKGPDKSELTKLVRKHGDNRSLIINLHAPGETQAYRAQVYVRR